MCGLTAATQPIKFTIPSPPSRDVNGNIFSQNLLGSRIAYTIVMIIVCRAIHRAVKIEASVCRLIISLRVPPQCRNSIKKERREVGRRTIGKLKRAGQAALAPRCSIQSNKSILPIPFFQTSDPMMDAIYQILFNNRNESEIFGIFRHIIPPLSEFVLANLEREEMGKTSYKEQMNISVQRKESV